MRRYEGFQLLPRHWLTAASSSFQYHQEVTAFTQNSSFLERSFNYLKPLLHNFCQILQSMFLLGSSQDGGGLGLCPQGGLLRMLSSERGGWWWWCHQDSTRISIRWSSSSPSRPWLWLEIGCEEDGEDKLLNKENDGRHTRFWLRGWELGWEGCETDEGGRNRNMSSPAAHPPRLPLSPSTAASLSSRDVSISCTRSCTVRSPR